MNDYSKQHMNLSMVLRPGGYYRSAWRHPASKIDQCVDLDLYKRLAKVAEEAHFDALFLADALNLAGDPWDDLAQPLEPMTLLSALAAVTSRIGLIATVSTTYSEPYNVARQFASLDHLSRGRAGWNVVTTADGGAAANFGIDHPDHARRYQRAREFVDVTTRLWSSWEEGAIVLDKASGTQTDRNRIKPIDFHGEYFHVRGPLNVPRSPQVGPVLFHAGQSPDGLVNAVSYAQGLFAVHHDRDKAAAFLADLDSRLVAAGRAPGSCLVLPGLLPILGSTEAEAKAEEQRLIDLGGQSDIDREIAFFLDTDLALLDPDAPIDLSRARDLDRFDGPQSWLRQLQELVSGERLTLNQLRQRYARIGRSGHLQLVGTPEQIADVLEDWFRHRACHGFNLMATTMPQSIEVFAREVVPILVRRGLFRDRYTHDTLRGHLGLEEPAVVAG